MEDELSQLDELIESDVLDALGEETLVSDSNEIDTKDSSDDTDTVLDEILIEDFDDSENIQEEEEEIISADTNSEEEKLPSESQPINLNSSDLSSLLSELLNNKTIEITIKIKD
ncbi:MAG: hypothetical protein U9N59_04925 [Campylobacterota bacterium]|nr:hypothetical protein [Campylobacterota bacterium]